MQRRELRIAVAGFLHESNTFSGVLTTLTALRDQGLVVGSAAGGCEGSSMVDGAMAVLNDASECHPVPLLRAHSTPGGRVTDSALDYVRSTLLDQLGRAGALDALVLLLHGACVSESIDDADGRIVLAARDLLGDETPIVLGLDHHANITKAMVEGSTAIVGHRSQPHDFAETGRLAATLAIRAANGESMTTSYRKMPLITHQEQFTTQKGPMKRWFDEARRWEREPGVLAVSPFPMQPWLDVDDAGWAVTAVTSGAYEHGGEAICTALADMAWSLREEFQERDSIPVRSAIDLIEPGSVTILGDVGDSVLAGGGGDSPVILAALLARPDVRALVPIVDPDAVMAIRNARIGDDVQVAVGGGVTGLFEPVQLHGVVHAVADLEVVLDGYPDPMLRWGPVVVLRVGELYLVISQRVGVGGVHPGCYASLGIDMENMDCVVVKTASNFQYFESPKSRTVKVDTPGPTQSALADLRWTRVPRPIYPLDADPAPRSHAEIGHG